MPRYTSLFLSLLVCSLASCSRPPERLLQYVVSAVPTVTPAAPTPAVTPTQSPTVRPSATLEATATRSSTSTPEPIRVPRYGVFEQSFEWNSTGYDNPWEQVRVTMRLSAPLGRTVTVGGFYYAENVWQARFAPDEIGDWAWQATIEDGTKSAQESGRFTVVGSDWPGFVRQNPNNKFRWVFDNGAPYYPLGMGDCML